MNKLSVNKSLSLCCTSCGELIWILSHFFNVYFILPVLAALMVALWCTLPENSNLYGLVQPQSGQIIYVSPLLASSTSSSVDVWRYAIMSCMPETTTTTIISIICLEINFVDWQEGVMVVSHHWWHLNIAALNVIQAWFVLKLRLTLCCSIVDGDSIGQTDLHSSLKPCKPRLLENRPGLGGMAACSLRVVWPCWPPC